MLVSLNQVSKGFGDRTILDNVTLSIGERDRIGLIGPNGAGKSTLLNLLCGRLELDAGEIGKKSGLSVGYLEQNTGLNREGSIWEAMRSVFAPLLEAEEEMRRLEEQMASFSQHGPEYEAVSREYARISAYFEGNGGYEIDVKIRTVLGGMGFSDKSYDTRVSTLSGGEKTRLALARILLEEPELLILDEPTNHLDFSTLMWLEEYLQSYRGALLVVSHDRYFLDKMAKTIWELDRAQLTVYKGNYSQYKILRQERRDRMQKEYDQQQEQIAAMEEYIQKNIARATTANSAKSRVHQLENMERKEKPLPEQKPPSFSFSYRQEPGKEVLSVSDLTLEVGAGQRRKTLAEHLDFLLRRGEKAAVIGPNGVGKSTLLKTILGQLPQQGKIRWGVNVKWSYYDQENQNLTPENTVLEELWKLHPMWPEHQVRGMLGRMRLTGDQVYQKVSALSGGERAKLCFAILQAKDANLLILDEPTNHLDLASKEALEQALMGFEGSILFVSHDRYFLNRVPTKILELSPQGLREYPGRFDDYLEVKNQETLLEPVPALKEEKPKKQDSGYRSRQQRGEDARRRTRLRQLEEQISRSEAQIKELEEKALLPETVSDYTVLQEVYTQLEEAKRQQEADLEEWMLLQEEAGQQR